MTRHYSSVIVCSATSLGTSVEANTVCLMLWHVHTAFEMSLVSLAYLQYMSHLCESSVI